MAKRFTDTEKWKKPFIKSLPTEYKLFWIYLLDDCDFFGVWHIDFDVAEIRLGMKLSPDKIVQAFTDRIIEFDNKTKWFIPDFIKFQYGEQLVISNRMHKPIIDKLTRYNLLKYVDCEVVNEGTTKHAVRSRVTQKVKDKIFLRDGFVCQYCSNQRQKEELIVDHIIPIEKGGDSDDSNLATSCVRCNSRKTDLSLNDFLSRGHDFLNPSQFILSLNGAYKKPEGAKEQDKDLDKDKELVKDNGQAVIYSIEHCLTVSMNDPRWVKANSTTENELKEFNSLLEKRGVYQKNPMDYKHHFANWKRLGKKESQIISSAPVKTFKEQQTQKFLSGQE